MGFPGARAGVKSRLQQSWHPQIKDRRWRVRADHSELFMIVHIHSVADHEQNGFAYRAFGDDAHAAKGVR